MKKKDKASSEASQARIEWLRGIWNEWCREEEKQKSVAELVQGDLRALQEEASVKKLTRRQQLRKTLAELEERRKKKQVIKAWCTRETKEIDRLEKQAKREYSERHERERQLKELAKMEAEARERFAQEQIKRILWNTKDCPVASELLALRPEHLSGGKPGNNARYNAFLRSTQPQKWTILAESAGVTIGEFMLRKRGLETLLGYSPSGIEDLVRDRVLPQVRKGYRTRGFLLSDVRTFIKTSAKWQRRASHK